MQLKLFTTFILLLAIGNAFAQTDTVRPWHVLVLPESAPIPEHIQKKGEIEIRNGLFKESYYYEEIMDMAREQAAAQGGNIVKITKFNCSDDGYGMFADVYLSPDRSAIWDMQKRVLDSIEKDVSKSSPYAVVYLYRSRHSGSPYP